MISKHICTKYCTGFLFSTLLAFAEPAVFGFGTEEGTDSQSQNMARMSLPDLRQKMMEQDERIDGLTTIIEGLSATVNALESKALQSNDTESKPSEALLQKLVSMIDEINAKYVSKEELKTFLVKLEQKPSVKKEKEEENPKLKSEIKPEKSAATLYSEGVRHFVKQRYNEARKRFTLTESKHYKPAASNYYLGEVAYYTKQYEDAIFHYKKSAGLYDKATYMDTLLLHTAISLDKTGKKSQAKVFYDNIIENYPEQKTAKIARKRVERL